MTLLLIRHGHAVTAGENPLRPLSDLGRAQAAEMAAFFRMSGQFLPAAIWHSPLARARESASLFATSLNFTGPVLEVRGLRPEDDPRVTAGRLAGIGEGLVIVGHEPHLSALATLLVCGPAKAPVVILEKGACLGLEQAEGGWRIGWLVGPGLIAPGPQGGFQTPDFG